MENEELADPADGGDDDMHVTFNVMSATEEMDRTAKTSGNTDKHFRDSLRESIVKE